MQTDIPAYDDFLSSALRAEILRDARAVPGVPGLQEVGQGGGLETPEALRFVCDLYQELKAPLKTVLEQRHTDRKFIDERTKAMQTYNVNLRRDFLDPDYQTVIGLEDAQGRVVVGPLSENFASGGGKPVAPIPAYLQGPHVTLFGPPDSAKLSINAMNAFHRQLPGEPAIVGELLDGKSTVPKWGADDEDSKTPLRQDLIAAGVNLSGCFKGTLKEVDSKSGKVYELAKDQRSLPLKRFPGLALPSFFLFFEGNPLPLHLYDFALHLFEHWDRPEALTFYVPKLENEEEARYIHTMVARAEGRMKELHPTYQLGTIRLLIVLENPRAILRTHEIMDALYPYFAGASLGWHDYLASTARVFKEDPNYRIPVKADPNIVIKYIKASHNLLADVVGPRGGIKVGGMYGILPTSTDLLSDSFQVTIKGYIKDVITQMKRDLTGFWVAHPDFVRLGMAMVEAWKSSLAGDKTKLDTLVCALLKPEHHQEILSFIHGPDITGLDKNDPLYVRSLLVADIKESTFIANHHPDEIRYNVFQSLQYLADWLSGNGCVALPAQIGDVPVRVMDDLATAERSRWEVWHEIYHGRFSQEAFLQIAHEEYLFIRQDQSNQKKIVQVKWDERTEKWYPVAFQLMLKLMLDKNPVEFATQLLLPFTLDRVRASIDPWKEVLAMDAGKFALPSYDERFNYYFERCGEVHFARIMAEQLAQDTKLVHGLILGFDKKMINAAASFHGDIGGGQKTLDHMAKAEQALVFSEDDKTKGELARLGEDYRAKFGMKFLVSAQGKTGKEMLALLQERLKNSADVELQNARLALSEITLKRIASAPRDQLVEKLEKLRKKHQIPAAQISICEPGPQQITLGDAEAQTLFQVASLSKTVASAFALEFCKARGISLETPVNDLLQQCSSFQLKGMYGDTVTLRQLMDHSALNMHYVQGIDPQRGNPVLHEWLQSVEAVNPPGDTFQYSGGGFLVLEHLLSQMSGKDVKSLTSEFLAELNLKEFDFQAADQTVPGTQKIFPAFAAGAVSTARDMHAFLRQLGQAFQQKAPVGPISHDTARLMLQGTDKGCLDFMGCLMGIGVFIGEAGDNRFMIHQGANDGFRAIYLHCFQGPDTGRGVVVLARGDLNGVLFIAEAVQAILQEMKFSGIDLAQFKEQFSTQSLKSEEIVNIGYRELIFCAFKPTLPPEITDKGPKDPLASFNMAVHGEVLKVSNQRFARATNLLSDYLPKFDPELFCFQGKVMDSWETVRHNPYDRDFLEFKVKTPAPLNYVSFSTKYHHGNQPQSVRLLAKKLETDGWIEVLALTHLEGHALKRIKLEEGVTYSYYRVEMFPDGGLTRIGLYSDLPAEEKPNFLAPEDAKNEVFPDSIPGVKKPLAIPYHAPSEQIARNLAAVRTGDLWDVASAAFGAKVIKATNEHYSPASQVISPFAPLSMFDGMESARSRRPGNFEEVVIQLAAPSRLHRLDMDFTYFVNNNPLEMEIQGLVKGSWVELLPRQRVKAFAGNQLSVNIVNTDKIEQLRVLTYPDGGMNRLHAYSEK